jgi:iron complex outermembrane recepter protein
VLCRLLISFVCLLGVSFGQRVGTPTDDLTKLAEDELFSIQVTSVGRKAQQLSKAPAAVFVLTAEDIRRSGATSIPEALRWVPGLTVLTPDGRAWVISARGSARLYADKILVMIDGRSLYTPMFSGVIWDAVNVPLGDVEQIEIVRGPGAVMWGPNAVNGVINIITRKSRATTGGYLMAASGNQLQGSAEARWGAAPNDRLSYRFWGKADYLTPAFSSPGVFALYGTSYIGSHIENLDEGSLSLGVRLDGQINSRNEWMLQASLFRTDRQDVLALPSVQPNYSRLAGNTDYRGGFIQGSWTRVQSAGNESVLRFSYDASDLRYTLIGGISNNLNIDYEKRRQTGARNEIFWGGGFQQYWDRTSPSASVSFDPLSAVYRSGNGVVRDEFQLVPGKLLASAGVRLDYNSFRNVVLQPSFRLLYTQGPAQSAWVAVSRAARTPNRVDRGFSFDDGSRWMPGVPLPISFQLHGSSAMRAEIARSAEFGYRRQVRQRWSIDASLFYTRFENLRSINATLPPKLSIEGQSVKLTVPGTFENAGTGRAYGAELWSILQMRNGWKLIPAYAYLRETRSLPASSATAWYLWDRRATDIRHQGSIRSQHDLSPKWQLDLMARLRSRDRTFGMPGAVLLDARLSRHLSRSTELSFQVNNLTNRQIMEVGSDSSEVSIPIRRVFLIRLAQRF